MCKICPSEERLPDHQGDATSLAVAVKLRQRLEKETYRSKSRSFW